MLEGGLAGYISNSIFHSNARLLSGAVLGERYWPLFRAVRLLRRDPHEDRGHSGYPARG